MDSVNSGSHQSSSDANDELYDDSRAAADSLFIPTHPSLSTYSIFTHHNSIVNPNSLPFTAQNSTTTADLSMITNSQPASLRPPPSSAADPTNMAARNPKKRSRASRRAPTTVLTTDTSNFRAMVQEFTGIPSTPFSNSINGANNTLSTSFSSRTRLDLFRSTALDRPSAYLRRPFPQKFQPTLANDTTTNISNVHHQQLSVSAQASSDLYNVAANPLLASLLQNATDKFVNPTSADNIHDRNRDYNHVFRTDGFHHREIDSGNFSSDHMTTLNVLPNQLVSTDDHEADDLMRPMKMAKYNGDSSNRDLASVAVTTSDQQAGMIESWVCSSQ